MQSNGIQNHALHITVFLLICIIKSDGAGAQTNFNPSLDTAQSPDTKIPLQGTETPPVKDSRPLTAICVGGKFEDYQDSEQLTLTCSTGMIVVDIESKLAASESVKHCLGSIEITKTPQQTVIATCYNAPLLGPAPAAGISGIEENEASCPPGLSFNTFTRSCQQIWSPSQR